MKRFYLVCIIFLLCKTALLAQTGVLPAYEIKTDTLSYTGVPPQNWQVLPDPSGKLSFAKVRSMPFLRFKTGEYRIQNFNNHVYWCNYKVRNSSTRPINVAIVNGISRLEVFAVDSAGKVTHKITGYNVPWSERSGMKRFRQAVFSIMPGQEMTFYERQYIDFRFEKRPNVYSMFRLIRDERGEAINIYEDRLKDVSIISFLCGLLILAALINVFFYSVSREKVYLYFALFSVFYALLAGNLPLYDVFLKEIPVLNRLNPELAALSGFFLWKFLSVFYDAEAAYPRWYKFSDYLSYALFPTLIIMIAPPISNVAVSGMITAVIVALFVVNGTLILAFSLFSSRQEKVFKLITALPFLSIGIIYLIADIIYGSGTAKNGLVLFVHNHGGDITLVCFYWLIILFLWKMIQRFQDLQKRILREALENERLARENEAERLNLIAAQKIELEQQVTERTAELKQSITDLKQTQTQLVQSEKMASLGELTAGIAHEIQNPLNFVNNFSEVSVELLDELEIELTNGDKEEAIAIANDVKQNLEKILHHGKRADGIVKGMLQHSRASSSTKEPTDINKLADEYLRLAYHGLRARDKSFNAELITNFDEGLPLVNIVPQDIGRVLLNLLTNAFYAVQQKQKTGTANYKPTVEVKTFIPASGGWGASVRDNGTGIPAGIKDKILQPFFTTKPTGEGTGLGLSLSYDIIVKTHGGKIEINTAEGEYTEFIISVPAKN